jgi:c-di-GMP-binding flagellar brake protein YcgR
MQLIPAGNSCTLESEADMQERRKQPRKDLMSYSQVYDQVTGKLIGYLGDLNLLGAMVIGDQPMQEGEDLTLSIELPELPDVAETSLFIPARVVRSHKDLSPEYFNIGLEFKTVNTRQKEIIQAVMENYEFRRQAPNYPLHPTEIDPLE